VRASGIPCDRCVAACAFGAVRLDEPARPRQVTVGAIVLATGLAPGEVAGPDGLVSSYQLERMLHPDGPTRGAVRGVGGRTPGKILLAADADDDGELPSLELLKLAHLVKARLPGAEVAIAGDLGGARRLRRRAAELLGEGILLLAGQLAPGGVSARGDALAVRLEGDGTERSADLVVVHAAAQPAPGTAALARLLRVATGDRGFLLDRGPSPFEPTATRLAGIYVAGAAAGPRTIAQAIRDGAAAAGLVHASLVPGERRAIEPLSAEVDEALCGGCGICASACPFGGIALAPSGKARVDAVHCRGCGTCAAACPTGAASARHFTRAQIAAEISGLLGGGA
jgi:heterodisulfide reductase subunit A